MDAQKVICPQVNYPLAGYSLEKADAPEFVSNGFGPIIPPPLGYSFNQSVANAIAISLISQADADAKAAANAVAIAKESWFSPTGIAVLPAPSPPAADFVDVPPIL